MIRIILFTFLIGAIVYFTLLFRERYKQLSPDKQKRLLSFGLEKFIALIQSRYHIVVQVVWALLRNLIKR
ncbi:MAG: hypothetical protein U9N49_10475 [Campylobacterota bacterium]|nr:hypothetical protein [Campylobacterota bacterium]